MKKQLKALIKYNENKKKGEVILSESISICKHFKIPNVKSKQNEFKVTPPHTPTGFFFKFK